MPQLLKKDLFGSVWLDNDASSTTIVRVAGDARWWVAGVARALMRREARALIALHLISEVPDVLSLDKNELRREFIEGRALHQAQSTDAAYYRAAMRLVRRMHAQNVVHNDLAKEPNILVRPDGTPSLIDFQLAQVAPRRGRLFRLAGREDIRHMLKHKRTYRPDLLTKRELTILETPSLPSRIWMATIKPIYVFVTRRVLGWADREGAADRGRPEK